MRKLCLQKICHFLSFFSHQRVLLGGTFAWHYNSSNFLFLLISSSNNMATNTIAVEFYFCLTFVGERGEEEEKIKWKFWSTIYCFRKWTKKSFSFALYCGWEGGHRQWHSSEKTDHCNSEADKNVIYASRPPNHRKIHNDKFVSSTYSSSSPLSRLISFRSVLSCSFIFFGTSSKKEKRKKI